MDRMMMKIDGMTCGHCVGVVRAALQEVDGVTIEQVSVGAATVAYDASSASPERIAKAIEDAGYAVVAAE